VQEDGCVLADYPDISMIEVDREISLFGDEGAFLRKKNTCNNRIGEVAVFL